MRLHADWCEAGFDPDAFWAQTPRTLRSAMAGYMERVYKAAELARFKVQRAPAKPVAQTGDQLASAMRAWAAASRRRDRGSAATSG